MKHSFIWLILCIIGSPCVSPTLGQDCQPITGTSNLARTSNTINQTIGINSGFDIERFFGVIPNYSYNQDSILLSDVMETSPIIRFFYSQNKDYDNRTSPKDYENLGLLSFDELINMDDRSTHLTENYVRILPLFEAGFEVQVAIEISHGKVFPDKWWTLEELSAEAANNSSPNMSRVVDEVSAEGKDWATAFLKIYDPKDTNGGFASKPIVTVLELGNEPWGTDLGVEGFRAYIRGMYDAFVDYYENDRTFRIKLAGAAFQGHASIGSDFYSGNLLDYAGTMIGDEGNSLVDLGPLRNAMTEGVGVHNYSFTDYCDVDANTLINHPERTNNGFMAYKNISEWVTNNMPAGSQKVNATEYGWNSEYEPRLYFPCAEGKVNQWGGCDEVTTYDEVVAIGMNGLKYDYNKKGFTDQITQNIVGRTAQAAYIIRSTLIMNRWGVNKAMLYGLLDDWANPLYFSNGLIDTDRAQSADISLAELKAIPPNPSGKKESWYAVKRLKEILGDKYFLEQYGSEEDGGTYTYTFGDHENGPPTYLVTWTAVNINELEGGAYVNLVNDNNNINAIQNIEKELDLSTLDLPVGASIDFSQPAIYLNGKLNNDWKDTQDLLVNNDATKIRVSPIPVVIPLQVETIPCSNLRLSVEDETNVVITNDIAPSRITYVDNNDPGAPPVINNVCDGDCELSETVRLPIGSFGFSVRVEDGGEVCNRTLSVQIREADPCSNATIVQDEEIVSIGNNNDKNTLIQILDLSNSDIIFDNQNLTSFEEIALTPGSYAILMNRQSCQQILVTENAVGDPSANTLQCQGATIHYREGKISVAMDDGRNAGIQIHDLDNDWVVVASNNYRSDRLEADLPKGKYLIKINSESCEPIELSGTSTTTPPPTENKIECQGATIKYGAGKISVAMDDGRNAGIQIHDLDNDWVVVASNNYRSNRLEADLPKGEYLVKINSESCESIKLSSTSTTTPPPAAGEIECEGATITYGAGQISVVMDNEQNAGIQIHDLDNDWAVVASNNYGSSNLVVDLPEGEYLVKINSNECEEIYLEPAPETSGTICSEATVQFYEGTIDVLMQDRQLATIEILNEAGESMIRNTVPRIQLIIDDLLPGNYTVVIDGNTCKEIMINPSQNSLSVGNDHDLSKSVTLFPNPAQTYIQVDLSKLAGLAGTIQIYDAYGQIITEHKTERLNNYERLDLSKARNGLHYMTIKAKDKKRIGKRFVVEDGK